MGMESPHESSLEYNEGGDMITSAEVKEVARGFGADLVGIGDIRRFEGVPALRDPRHVAPAAKSVIGLGFRVLRGSLRGVEEGTQFYQFSQMGVVGIDERIAPDVLRRVACHLEDNGYEGVVQRAEPDRRPASDTGANPELRATHKINARPVAPGRPPPDVVMDFNVAAYVCGLGEIGEGGFFLTPEFGPLQRFAFILTDAELEPDPIYAGQRMCDRCGECATACPGKAIIGGERTRRSVNGSVVESAALDEWQCLAYYMGAHAGSNPFLPPGAYDGIPDGGSVARGERRLAPDEVERLKPILGAAYAGMNFGYNACVCGKACQRACLAALERRGVLRKRFKTPFRKAVG